MKNNISILGVGNLTQSLLASLNTNNFKGKIYLYDIDKLKKKNAKATNIVFKENLHDFLKSSKILIIAVKPANYKKVFANIREQINPDTVIISLMAGIKINEIANECNGHKIIIRAMTNINAKYSNAISFFYFNKKIKSEHRRLTIKLFNNFGSVHLAKSELEIDKVTALIGSGPAYFIYFAESLAKVFEGFGFSKKLSTEYVNELFYGTSLLCKNDVRPNHLLIKSIASKGGTTQAALKILGKNKFRSILDKSIKAAYKKSKNMVKNK